MVEHLIILGRQNRDAYFSINHILNVTSKEKEKWTDKQKWKEEMMNKKNKKFLDSEGDFLKLQLSNIRLP